MPVEWPARCPFPGCGEELYGPTDAREHLTKHEPEIARLGVAFAAAEARRKAEEATVGQAVPAGVLVRERMQSTYRVDHAMLEAFTDPAVFETQVRDRLTRQLQEYASGYGFDVRPFSIWFEVTDQPGIYGVDFTAVWAPNPETGCELRGGPKDGEIYALARDHGSPAPISVLRVLAPGPLGFPPTSPVETIATVEHRYRRAGIDSMRDCWVYEYEGAA